MRSKLLYAAVFALIFGCSLNDDEQGATPCSFCGISPKAQYDVAATANSESSVAISWSPVSYATGYYIYRSTSANGFYAQVGSVGSAATSYTDNSAQSGTTYYYTVAAYNSNGTGSQSSYASAITRLNAPTGVSASASSVSSITVSWPSVSNATGYNIYRSTAANGAYTQIGSANSASYTDNNLSPGTTYYYMVSAYNSNVTSTQSSHASATTHLNAPTGVTASASSVSSIAVSWQSVSNATGYNIYRSTTEYGAYAQIGSANSASYTDNNLQSGITYYYKVAAYNSSVESPQSNYASATTHLNTPTGVTATANSTSSITVSWQPVSNASGYHVYRSTTATGAYDQIGNSTTASYTDNSVLPGTTYYYKVAAYNSSYTSPQSNYASAATQLNTPTGITATANSTSSITVSWQPVSNATGYYIYRSTSATGPYTQYGPVSSSPYTDNNAQSGTIYYYKVAAYNNNGTGPQSDYAYAITQLNTPTASASSTSSITVNWQSVTGATGYNIYRSTTEYGTYAQVGSAGSTATSYADNNLQSGTTYYYKVSAYNSSGVESPRSNPASATTRFNVSASSNSTGNITISWQSVTGATGYNIYRGTTEGTYGNQFSSVSSTYTDEYNLSPGTTYYYRVDAYNSNGTVVSQGYTYATTTQ